MSSIKPNVEMLIKKCSVATRFYDPRWKVFSKNSLKRSKSYVDNEEKTKIKTTFPTTTNLARKLHFQPLQTSPKNYISNHYKPRQKTTFRTTTNLAKKLHFQPLQTSPKNYISNHYKPRQKTTFLTTTNLAKKLHF